jgi:hypothetical protein
VGRNAPRTSAAECWTKPMVRALESRKVLYGNCMATQRQGNGDRPRGGPRKMFRDFFRNPTRTASRSITSCRAASGLGRSGSFRPTWSCAVSFRGRGSGARQPVGSQQTRAPDPRPAPRTYKFELSQASSAKDPFHQSAGTAHGDQAQNRSYRRLSERAGHHGARSPSCSSRTIDGRPSAPATPR